MRITIITGESGTGKNQIANKICGKNDIIIEECEHKENMSSKILDQVRTMINTNFIFLQTKKTRLSEMLMKEFSGNVRLIDINNI